MGWPVPEVVAARPPSSSLIRGDGARPFSPVPTPAFSNPTIISFRSTVRRGRASAGLIMRWPDPLQRGAAGHLSHRRVGDSAFSNQRRARHTTARTCAPVGFARRFAGS